MNNLSSEYNPNPIDTKSVLIPNQLSELVELLAENTHENWALNRKKQGWKYGKNRNDEKKETPCLVPYNQLSEEEKEYDRITSLETIKTIIKMGYTISKK